MQFEDQEIRRQKYGSAFLEISYRKSRKGLFAKNPFAISSLPNWQNDSLYVFIDDIDEFCLLYKDLFGEGYYQNGKTGKFDNFGVTYYTADTVDEIIKRILAQKPVEHEIITEWLSGARNNGFYILGI